MQIHVVQPGQSLSGISQAFGVSVQSVADANEISGKQHIVWFEDAHSIQAKFNLVKELGLRGVSYWKLGLAFSQNWLLIEDNFTVVKK